MAKGQKTGGRVAGTPNKATREIKEIAQSYGPEAIAGLWTLATGAESEQARVSAYKEILDRGYGKPGQSIAVGQDPDLGPIQTEEVNARELIASRIAGIATRIGTEKPSGKPN